MIYPMHFGRIPEWFNFCPLTDYSLREGGIIWSATKHVGIGGSECCPQSWTNIMYYKLVSKFYYYFFVWLIWSDKLFSWQKSITHVLPRSIKRSACSSYYFQIHHSSTFVYTLVRFLVILHVINYLSAYLKVLRQKSRFHFILTEFLLSGRRSYSLIGEIRESRLRSNRRVMHLL